jgi:ketosteroid isomerase-like protein
MSGRAIIEAENRWARAMLRHDRTVLKALLHPNFIFLGLKSAGLQSWSRIQFAAAVLQIDYHRLEHEVRDLQMFGSIAIATVDGRWTAETGVSAFDEEFLATDVWTKTPDGPWRVIRRHSSRYVEDKVTGKPLDAPALVLDV